MGVDGKVKKDRIILDPQTPGRNWKRHIGKGSGRGVYEEC